MSGSPSPRPPATITSASSIDGPSLSAWARSTITAFVEKSSSATGTSSTSASPPLSAGSKVPERTSAMRGSPFQVDLRDDGVLQRRPLAHERSVSQLEVDEVPVEPGAEPRRQAGGHVGREHGRAEEDGVEALVPDEPGEHVHPRLRERSGERGVVGGVDLRGAEPPGLGGELPDAGAGHDRGDVAAELRRLRQHAERALDELALVVLEEDEGRHPKEPLR